MSAILKFDFTKKKKKERKKEKKRKQLPFSEVNYLNYTKETKFCMKHFPWNKGKQEQTVYPFHTP